MTRGLHLECIVWNCSKEGWKPLAITQAGTRGKIAYLLEKSVKIQVKKGEGVFIFQQRLHLLTDVLIYICFMYFKQMELFIVFAMGLDLTVQGRWDHNVTREERFFLVLSMLISSSCKVR